MLIYINMQIISYVFYMINVNNIVMLEVILYFKNILMYLNNI